MDSFDHMTENVGNSHSLEKLMGNSNSFDPWEFPIFSIMIITLAPIANDNKALFKQTFIKMLCNVIKIVM